MPSISRYKSPVSKNLQVTEEGWYPRQLTCSFMMSVSRSGSSDLMRFSLAFVCDFFSGMVFNWLCWPFSLRK